MTLPALLLAAALCLSVSVYAEDAALPGGGLAAPVSTQNADPNPTQNADPGTTPGTDAGATQNTDPGTTQNTDPGTT
ncbi:MAG TPA: hypothetical protein H9795_11560, partial [Candidatus Fournierella merdigallinarum]|nr:hypothetical protein [Candidatus Fournierella merdigallinarum]